MDALPEFLNHLKQLDAVGQHFVGLLHILIGRRVVKQDGTVVANGMTWRALASELKRVRWDREVVRTLGLNPDDLPPRDREKFWYTAIARAQVDSAKARQDGDELAAILSKDGYVIGPAPGK